jgi:radical SAM protein with 4Fe4S-binding SPASM domain
MTPELIVSCIEWYAKLMKRAGRDVLNIHFFGGEPFVQPALCMMAVHAARVLAERYGMRAVFEAATNGVMSEQTAQFVSDAIDHIVLSLDGPPEIQNKHRPLHNGGTSFESVYRSARIFSEGPANLCLRACITSETVGRMEEIALWFCGEFKPSSVSFETLQESPESKKAGFQAPDPWDFAMNFVKAEVILDRFGVETVYATAGTQAQTFSFCPVAKDVPIVSPDGQIAGCYLLEGDWQAREMDLHLGKVSASGKVRLQKKSIERLRALNVTRKPRCEQCFCKWHCAGGCHVNHSFPGCARNYDSLCLQTRVIALFRILKSLKREDLFERLVEDRPSLEKIVLQNSDVFSYQRMEEAHA